MSQFTIGAYEMQEAVASDFQELLAIIIKGVRLLVQLIGEMIGLN
jgi:hypothetical protein